MRINLFFWLDKRCSYINWWRLLGWGLNNENDADSELQEEESVAPIYEISIFVYNSRVIW